MPPQVLLGQPLVVLGYDAGPADLWALGKHPPEGNSVREKGDIDEEGQQEKHEDVSRGQRGSESLVLKEKSGTKVAGELSTEDCQW